MGGGRHLAINQPGPAARIQYNFCIRTRRPAGAPDKIHLFNFQRGAESYDEAIAIRPGKAVQVFDGPCGRVGLSVCYDLRFPELYRAMGTVDLILVPAAFTYTTGQAHWELLLRARAIENQCYVLAPAQGGRHSTGRRTWGHSMLVDPWGRCWTFYPRAGRHRRYHRGCAPG